MQVGLTANRGLAPVLRQPVEPSNRCLHLLCSVAHICVGRGSVHRKIPLVYLLSSFTWYPADWIAEVTALRLDRFIRGPFSSALSR